VSLAKNLAAARAAAGLSQQKVTDATAIPRTAVSDIEHGKREVTALELKALADLYGTTANELLADELTMPSYRTPGSLLAQLERVTSDLHGYLEQRARELAGPLVEAAEREAEERVRQFEAQAQRQQDLIDELRRQLTCALRDGERARHKTGMRHNTSTCGDCVLEEQAARVLPGRGTGAST
jgi:transcriptional regulator with XRE-family HTH domain